MGLLLEIVTLKFYVDELDFLIWIFLNNVEKIPLKYNKEEERKNLKTD